MDLKVVACRVWGLGGGVGGLGGRVSAWHPVLSVIGKGVAGAGVT